jgi:hypothetical protein
MLKLVKDTGQFDASLKAFGYLNDDGSIRDAS